MVLHVRKNNALLTTNDVADTARGIPSVGAHWDTQRAGEYALGDIADSICNRRHLRARNADLELLIVPAPYAGATKTIRRGLRV
jgi:hypothetical protein